MSWAVLRILAGLDAGKRVERGLNRLSFPYFNPCTYEEWASRGRRMQRTVQLFPGYVFVWISSQWRVLLGVRGVTGLIQDASGPIPVRSDLIEALKRDTADDGLIHLPAAPPRFKQGQNVLLNSGAFDHKVVVYQGMCGAERCAVLLRMLGKQVRIVVPEQALAEVI